MALNVSTESGHKRFATNVLARESKLVRVNGAVPATRPTLASGNSPAGADPMTDNSSSTAFASDGDDGTAIADGEISAATPEAPKRGLWALEKADLFNPLCVPPLTRAPDGNVSSQTRSAAATYCRRRRALYIVDPLNAAFLASDDGAAIAMSHLLQAAHGEAAKRHRAISDVEIRGWV